MWLFRCVCAVISDSTTCHRTTSYIVLYIAIDCAVRIYIYGRAAETSSILLLLLLLADVYIRNGMIVPKV